MTELRNLTVVIPTYNRPFVVVKQARFLLKKGLSILVLDGSDVPNTEIMKMEIQSQKLKYIHDKSGLASRYRRAVPFVNTKYVLTFSDDDFLAINGIEYILSEMRTENLDYAFGSFVLAYPLGTSWLFRMWSPPFFTRGNRLINEEDSLIRTQKHFSTYVTTYYYCVSKVENWKKVFKDFEIEIEQISSPYVHELLVEYLSAFYGKVKIFPHITAVRIQDNPPAWLNHDDNYGKYLKITQWLGSNEYRTEVNLVLNSVKKILGSTGVKPESIAANFLQCLFSYSKLEISNAANDSSFHEYLFALRKSLIRLRLALRIRLMELFFLLHLKSKQKIAYQNLNNLIFIDRLLFNQSDRNEFLQYLLERTE